MAKDAPVEKRDITRRAVFAVALTAAVGVALTLVITAAGFAPAYQNRALHAAKETAAAVVLWQDAAEIAIDAAVVRSPNMRNGVHGRSADEAKGGQGKTRSHRHGPDSPP